MSAVVALRDIVDALDMQGDESRNYLDPATGKIVLISDEEVGLIEDEADLSDLPDWQRESLPKLREAWNSGRLLALPDKFEIHEWKIMEEFASSREDEVCREELGRAIHGRGAFRMFRDCLGRHDLVAEWHRFRNEQFEQIAMDWLEGHGLAYQ